MIIISCKESTSRTPRSPFRIEFLGVASASVRKRNISITLGSLYIPLFISVWNIVGINGSLSRIIMPGLCRNDLLDFDLWAVFMKG